MVQCIQQGGNSCISIEKGYPSMVESIQEEIMLRDRLELEVDENLLQVPATNSNGGSGSSSSNNCKHIPLKKLSDTDQEDNDNGNGSSSVCSGNSSNDTIDEDYKPSSRTTNTK
jgi:hypothetical protein